MRSLVPVWRGNYVLLQERRELQSSFDEVPNDLKLPTFFPLQMEQIWKFLDKGLLGGGGAAFILTESESMTSVELLFMINHQISSVQSLSPVRLFVTPWIAARQASLSITNSQSSLRLTSIQSVMPSSHLILCRPLFLLPQSLPASESFPMSQLFASGGQSTGVSALATFLPKKSQGWSPSEWSVWISLQCKGLSKVFLPFHNS